MISWMSFRLPQRLLLLLSVPAASSNAGFLYQAQKAETGSLPSISSSLNEASRGAPWHPRLQRLQLPDGSWVLEKKATSPVASLVAGGREMPPAFLQVAGQTSHGGGAVGGTEGDGGACSCE